MPRSAVKVTKSSEAYVRQRFQEATALEKRLQVLTSTNNAAAAAAPNHSHSLADQANQIRVPLCEIYSDVLLTDPAYALQKDVTGRLWRHCFYSRIGPNRARIAKEKRKSAATNTTNSTNTSTSTGNTTTAAKLEKNLHFFLAESVTLYDYLAEKLSSKLATAVLGSSTTPGGSTSNANNGDESTAGSLQTLSVAAPTTTSTAGIVECLHRLFICMGDLYRYSNQLAAAEKAYTTAAQLGPGMGHPFNQLAVVCAVKDQAGAAPLSAVALFWYCRSLQAATDVFETSKTNLQRLLKNNREWLKQQECNEDATAGATTVTSKSAQSRRFLAIFVDLHYYFFQGLTVQDTATLAAMQQAVRETMELCQTMLQNSALGDSLLCKLVTIGAFSECYLDRQVLQQAAASTSNNLNSSNQVQHTTAVAARTANLQFGACLADRVLFGLTKLQAPVASSKAPPSVRLLLPLLMLSEYVASSPLPALSGTAHEHVPGNILDRHEAAASNFWKKIVDILNKLQALALQLDVLSGGTSTIVDQLKEYQNLRGFKPFERFISPVSTSGYLNDAQAVEALNLGSSINASQGGPASILSPTQDSATVVSAATTGSSSANNSVDQSRAKIVRFLNLGQRLVTMNEFASRIEKTLDGQFEWFGENDDAMDLDAPNFSDDENVAMDNDRPAAETPVLVFKEAAGGGPALLVPGGLLQEVANDSPPAAAVDITTDTNAFESTLFQPQAPMHIAPPESNIIPLLTGGLRASLGVGLPVSVPPGMMAATTEPTLLSPLVSAPPASLLPPPGFGAHVDGNGETPDLSSSVMVPQLLPGFESNSSILLNQSTRNPTFGESMHLFGGSSAMQTANPFATSMPSGNNPYGSVPGMFGSSLYAAQGPESLFGHGDALGPDGASLLDSSFLNSLWMDESSPRKTKNPFAT